MKKHLLIVAALATTAASAFAQGYVTLNTSTHNFYDAFTTPGVGVYGNANIDYAIYWALVTTSDPLATVGTQLGQRNGPAIAETATNGVASMAPINVNSVLTGAGWTLGLNAGNSNSVAAGTTLAAAQAGFGQFTLAGTTAGNTYQMIIVGWNAVAGMGAITTGSYTAVGWSNPFSYLTGSSASDPNGTAGVGSVPNSNQFGVIPIVPEPGTLALAALGGASLLMFRRKK